MAKDKSGRVRNIHEIPSTTKWTTQKKVILGVAIAAAVVVVIVAIVLGVVLTRNNGTTSTTTQAPIVNSIYWTLDAISSDTTGVYNGTLMNGAYYFSTTNTQPYTGLGRGLALSSAGSQYMTVASPFFDLTYKSFTVEAWIYSSTPFSGDNGIFGQCQCGTCANQCFYFLVRGSRLYAGFTSNEIYGSKNITINLWYHVAFVYNNATQQQILYVNGYQDAIASNSNPYQGTSGSMDLGSTTVLLVRNYMTGYLDNVKVTTRAKSAAEILFDGSLTAYYSFDVPSPYLDNGPNGINGTQNNAVITSGHLNQAIRFTGSSSYFLAYGFYQVGYGVPTSQPFSVSLWINPLAVTSSVIVQFAYSLSPYGCHNLIGIWSTIGSTGQIIVQGWSWPYIIGPFLTIGTWTHVSVTYSVTNGLSLYVNGVYFGNTGPFVFYVTGSITYLELGYYTYCSSAYISNNAYQGSVDEVYVHAREITPAEVTALASV